MFEPAYSFTIPSLYDDTPLECRVYHPKRLGSTLDDLPQSSIALRGAVIAHPYAPLGGSFDDGVVLSVAQCLVKQGFIVGTFNFRGATGSKDSTSWTGKPEREDYIAFAGFMVYYLHYLGQAGSNGPESPSGKSKSSLDVLLAGYSYGSLILSRLPPMSSLVNRFDTAERGTAAAEVILRAQRLARETQKTVLKQQISTGSRGRQLSSVEKYPHAQGTSLSAVIVGGEETAPGERRRSREHRRSASVVREVPRRIKAHIRHHSDGHHSDAQPAPRDEGMEPKQQNAKPISDHPPEVSVSYLLISPVLPPLAHALVPPASMSALLTSSKGAMEKDTGVGSLQEPTLTVFGSTDGFTSGKWLKAWCDKLAAQAPQRFTYAQIDGAGHFWRESDALQGLRRAVSDWVSRSTL